MRVHRVHLLSYLKTKDFINSLVPEVLNIKPFDIFFKEGIMEKISN